MNLWLIRHAPPLIAPGTCYGILDVAADPVATREAAQSLASALPHGIRVQCSPLKRCTQLLDALLPLRPDLGATQDARLQEMDFGLWEGRHWDDIGEGALTAWTSSFAGYTPGGGECVSQFMQRVAQSFDELTHGAKDTAWITHAGVARAARLLSQGVRHIDDAAMWPKEALAHGAWSVLSLDANPPRY
jgi:alpha-ribazole phosphatase